MILDQQIPQPNVFCALGARLTSIFSNNIMLSLSWYTMESSISKLCALIKYGTQRNPGIVSSAPMITDYIEIHMLIFCFFNMIITNLRPRYMVVLVWPLIYSCTAYEAYTHHLITLRLSALTIGSMHIVLHRSWSTHRSLHQSSCSDSLIIVIKKPTTIWMSFLSLSVANRICDTLWWNSVTSYLYRIFL